MMLVRGPSQSATNAYCDPRRCPAVASKAVQATVPIEEKTRNFMSGMATMPTGTETNVRTPGTSWPIRTSLAQYRPKKLCALSRSSGERVNHRPCRPAQWRSLSSPSQRPIPHQSQAPAMQPAEPIPCRGAETANPDAAQTAPPRRRDHQPARYVLARQGNRRCACSSRASRDRADRFRPAAR